MPWRNDGSSGRNTPRQRGVLARLHSVSCHCQLTPVVSWLLFLNILAWNPRNKDLALQGTNKRDLARHNKHRKNEATVPKKLIRIFFSFHLLSSVAITISNIHVRTAKGGCDAVLTGLALRYSTYDIPTDSILPSVSLWHLLCRTK